MQTFGEILTAYMDRTGIGDAELARRMQVSRHTLLRWKEGATTRPRYRDDVLRCAELLRLAEREKDEFLLAAGFSPETVPPAIEASAAAIPEGGVDLPHTRRARGLRLGDRRSLALGGLALVLIAAAIAVAVTFGSGDRATYPSSEAGESLIVLAPFANYTGGGQGFNVLDRIRAALDGEILTAGLGAVRTAEWPRALDGREDAESASRRSGATLVIWGEYDSGRVVARFTAPGGRRLELAQQVVDIASTPADLPATINIGLPHEVRFVALVTLGQLYLERSEFDLARAMLIRALDPPPSEADALANLRFMLASAYMGGASADPDEAISLLTQVLAVQPGSVDALNSRALAYLDRGRSGDVELAMSDLRRAVTIRPDRAATHLNLAAAYVERGSGGDVDRALDSLNEALSHEPGYATAYVKRAAAYVARAGPGDLGLALGDLARALEIEPGMAAAHLGRGIAYLARRSGGDLQLAIEEFSRSISANPASSIAYFNRGLVHSELGNWTEALADLRRAHDLRPHEPAYNATLCWHLAAQRSQEALSYCDAAVVSDPEGLARDSRGMANALLGRTRQAIADFQAFLAWVDASPEEGCRTHYRPSRASWVEALEAGENPFEEVTPRDLRARAVPPGSGPC